MLRLYRSAVGKKAVMALTGLVLFGFVAVHLAGNLKLYQGAEKINAYGEFLREVGAPLLPHSALLWAARLVLIAAAALHIDAAVRLTLMNRRARPEAYQRKEHVVADYASRTMRWGGVIILLFVIYHLMHFTWGNAHPDFRPGDVYHNMVVGFSNVWVSGFYILAQLALGLHLYHGVWSMFQSLGLSHPRYDRWRRILAAVFAVAITLGNVSFPLAVLAGIVA